MDGGFPERISRWCAGVIAALGLLAAITAGCSKPPQAVVQEWIPPLPPPPPPPPIRIEDMSVVTLEPGGGATVAVKIDRAERAGPIAMKLGEVPEGIKASVGPVAEGQSQVSLALEAAASLGDSDLDASIPVTAAIGQESATRSLRVRVPRVRRPGFPEIDGIVLQPGTAQTVAVPVSREGFDGHLDFQLVDLPPGVSGTITPLFVKQDRMQLTLEAGAAAVERSSTAAITSSLYGREIRLAVPVVIDRRPFRLADVTAVTLNPGETRKVDLPISRRNYDGPIEVAVESLPTGVTAADVSAPADAAAAVIEFHAADDAKPCIQLARIRAQGGHLTVAGDLVVRVRLEDDGEYLPAEVGAAGENIRLLRRGGAGGRVTPASKQALAAYYGGTAASEAAIARGLEWLAKHQQADGSWIEDGVSEGNAVAGTAYALLPFLGEGVTHRRSSTLDPNLTKYCPVVEKGLVHLAQKQTRSSDRSDGYLGGGIRGHLLGTLALCEAYGLTGDDRLKLHARLAVKCLANAQRPAEPKTAGRKPAGGGWPDPRGQAEDLTTTGWAVLALRTGQMAGITIPSNALEDAEGFVKSCAAGPAGARESRYAEKPGGEERPEATAVGLFLRQVLGAKNTEPDLIAGCNHLLEDPPAPQADGLGRIGYFFFATQALRNMEGENFDRWNHLMREHLIQVQEREGEFDGSWTAKAGDAGGARSRIEATSLSIMTLQVYYRSLPMYRSTRRP
jgi:hypothetical protein